MAVNKIQKKKMEKIMREITNNMYRVHRGTYKAGKWSWNFSETTYLLPGGEWHMHILNVVIIRVKMVLQADDLIKLYKVALLFFADWHECCTSSQFTVTPGVHQNW